MPGALNTLIRFQCLANQLASRTCANNLDLA